jgi:outer membrane protein
MKLLLVASLAALSLYGQQPVPLTLADAEASAVKNNPDVTSALLNAAAANQVTIETHSAALPLVFGSVTGAGSLTGSRLAAGGLNNPIIYDRLAAGVTVSQLITDFGRTRDLTESSRLRAVAQDDSAKATRAAVVLQVDNAYFLALRAQTVLTVAQETVNARQTVSDQVTALANNQLKSGLDVSFANVYLSQAKLLLVDARNDVQSSQADLARAMGLSAQQQFQLSDPGNPGAPPPDAAPLIQRSLANRPELASLLADYDASIKFASAEKELRNPTLSGLASAGGIPAHEAALRGRYAAAGINLNIPLFNGHLFNARQAEAELRAQAARQNLRSEQNRITRDVTVAYLNAKNAYERLGLTAELVAQASQSLDLAQARYNLGLSSIVELTQAQLSKTSAEIASATAKFDYALQRAVLDFQTGVTR